MKRLITISFLFLIMIAILPWQALEFCVTHPLGHDHHHDGPSPCELREQVKEDSYLPPMTCYDFFADTDEYNLPDEYQMKPPVQTLVVALVMFDLIQFPEADDLFVDLPEQKSNSDPPLGVNALRGPPLV